MEGQAPGEPPDATLLQQHVQGDPDAFQFIYDRLFPRLYAVIHPFVGQREIAVSIAQAPLPAIGKGRPMRP